jgi:hypothetical protein
MTATAGAVLALYLLLGAGCLLAGWARARAAGERVLLLLFWPLMAPFLLRPAREEPAAPGGGGRHLTPGTPATALLSALERVAHSPLAPLLPDAPTVRRLAHHLEQVSTRVDELDEVLARPTFDLEAATARQGELEAAGASPELVVGAALRCQGLQRLRALRARLARELDEVSELMSQLVIQVELVRFAGAGDDGSRAILGELLGRVDGLAQMLDDQGGPAAARP